MDTRKLKKGTHGTTGQVAIHIEGRGIMATMEAGNDKTRNEDAAELVTRWNAHEQLTRKIEKLNTAQLKMGFQVIEMQRGAKIASQALRMAADRDKDQADTYNAAADELEASMGSPILGEANQYHEPR